MRTAYLFHIYSFFHIKQNWFQVHSVWWQYTNKIFKKSEVEKKGDRNNLVQNMQTISFPFRFQSTFRLLNEVINIVLGILISNSICLQRFGYFIFILFFFLLHCFGYLNFCGHLDKSVFFSYLCEECQFYFHKDYI